jgi:hypothetical protein
MVKRRFRGIAAFAQKLGRSPPRRMNPLPGPDQSPPQHIFLLLKRPQTNLECISPLWIHLLRRFGLNRARFEAQMSLIDETSTAAGNHDARLDDSAGAASPFRFLPRELAGKCRKLIESYHAMHGLGCLPDMLWHSDARDIIECHLELTQLFKAASKSRAAKRANDSLLLIATVVVSLEVLARDFAGWGKRFPNAKRQAERMLGDFPLRERTWLMDLYLYPPLGIHRDLVNTLAPSAAEPAMARS